MSHIVSVPLSSVTHLATSFGNSFRVAFWDGEPPRFRRSLQEVRDTIRPREGYRRYGSSVRMASEGARGAGLSDVYACGSNHPLSMACMRIRSLLRRSSALASQDRRGMLRRLRSYPPQLQVAAVARPRNQPSISGGALPRPRAESRGRSGRYNEDSFNREGLSRS